MQPIWIPVVASLACAVAMVYLAIWMVIASLWLTVIILLLCAPVGIVLLIWGLMMGYPLTGIFGLGICCVAAGVGLFAWLGILSAKHSLA